MSWLAGDVLRAEDGRLGHVITSKPGTVAVRTAGGDVEFWDAGTLTGTGLWVDPSVKFGELAGLLRDGSVPE